jgi:hypothetical protein
MLSLRKHSNNTGSQQLFAPVEQEGQGRQRARGHHLNLAEKARHHLLDPGGMDRHRRSGQTGGLAQKGAFAGIALDQIDMPAELGQADAQHEAGKAAAGTEIEPAPGLRCMIEQLQRIGDVAGPDLVERRARDQILGLLPTLQLCHQDREALLCFT